MSKSPKSGNPAKTHRRQESVRAQVRTEHPLPDPYAELKSRLFRRIKLPGWAVICWGLIIDLLALRDVTHFVADNVRQLGEWLSASAWFIGNPITGTVMVAGGVLYLIFVGEPKSPLSSRIWPYFTMGVLALFVVAGLLIADAAFVMNRVSPPPRVLTAHQRRVLKDEATLLTPFMPSEPSAHPPTQVCLTVVSSDTPEANAFAIQIMDALKAGGVCSQSMIPGRSIPIPAHVISVTARGLFIATRDAASPSEGARVLRKVLADAGLGATYDSAPAYFPNSFALEVEQE